MNINEQVRLKLTPLGVRFWVEERAKHGVTTEVASDGVLIEQLWVVMNVLGPHLFNGGKPLIVGNEIETANKCACFCGCTTRGPHIKGVTGRCNGCMLSCEPPEDWPTPMTSQDHSLAGLAEWVRAEWKPGESEAILRLAEGVLMLANEPENKRPR